MNPNSPYFDEDTGEIIEKGNMVRHCLDVWLDYVENAGF